MSTKPFQPLLLKDRVREAIDIRASMQNKREEDRLNQKLTFVLVSKVMKKIWEEMSPDIGFNVGSDEHTKWVEFNRYPHHSKPLVKIYYHFFPNLIVTRPNQIVIHGEPCKPVVEELYSIVLKYLKY